MSCPPAWGIKGPVQDENFIPSWVTCSSHSIQILPTPATMTRFFCCGSYFPGYPSYGTNFHRTFRATPLNCVVPLGSPLGYGCNGYSSLGYGFGGSNFSNLGCGYGGSFYRPWGSGSGFGYSTYWWTMAPDDYGTRPQFSVCRTAWKTMTVFLPPETLERDTLQSSWSPTLLNKSPRHQMLSWYSSTAKARFCISLTYLNFTNEEDSLSLIMIALPMYH